MATEFKISNTEMKAVLAEVEKDIASVLKSEGQKLAKGFPPKGDESPAEESAPEASASEAPAPAAEASAPPAAEASAPAPEAPAEASAPAPEAPMAPEAGPQDPAAEAGPVDPAMLEAEYDKLDDEGLKAHYMAAKSSLFKRMSAGAPPAGPEAGAPPAPVAAPPPGPEASAPPAFKAEMKSKGTPAPLTSTDENGTVLKSEPKDGKALAKAEAQISDLMAKVDGLTNVVTLLANVAPMRKAVTSIAHVPKSDVTEELPSLSKNEVSARLRKHSSSPETLPATRKLINNYYDGRASLKQIEHLLR